MKFNEQYTIEYHIIKFIKEKLGYEYVLVENFAKLRAFENEYIIGPHLLEAVKKINIVDDTVAQSVVREVKKLDTNEAFLLAMRNGINLKDFREILYFLFENFSSIFEHDFSIFDNRIIRFYKISI